ncbi:hypothetical protein [Algibacter mikhailovii]|uniref:hypothetical protein n=1 Tax=Algibacter mikhailovii TaxID=425498 RepID=UPI0024959EB7|nr:hypothetical protein [Algibacter mikhailovii]
MKIKSFSTLFGILFSIIGIIVGIWISLSAISNDYKYFYIYSGISGFITGKLFAKYIIEKKNRFNHQNYILVGIITGLLSHWLCWYLITLELNFRYWILNEHFSSRPIDPLLGIFGVLVFCLWSWLIVGWATVLGGIASVYGTKWIYEKNKSTMHNNV